MGFWGFLAVLANVFLSFLLWSLSWFVLLRGAGIPVRWGKVLFPMLAGAAVSYLTPSAYFGGEPVRAYWVAKEAGVAMAHAMAPVMVERLLSGFSLLFFAAIGGFFVFLSPSTSGAVKAAVGLALGGMAVLLILGILSFAHHWRWLSRLFKALSRLIPWRGVFLRLAASTAVMEYQIHRVFAFRIGHVLASLFFQLGLVFLNYIRPQMFFYFAKQALFTFPQLSLFFTLNLFINAFLWATPGGLGLTDGGRAGVFKLFGVSFPTALAYNVLFRFVEMLQVGIGVLVLLRRGLSLSSGQAVEEKKEAK